MMATFQGDVLLTAFFFNNLTGKGRSNYIHSTYVAYQTAKLPLKPDHSLFDWLRSVSFESLASLYNLFNYNCVLYLQQSLCRTLIQIIIQLEKLYICRGHRVHRGLGLDGSEFTKSVIVFIFVLY